MQCQNIALGTYRITGDDCIQIVSEGINQGFTHIDTAELYKNHKEVGQGIIKSGIPRDKLFITSKIFNPNIKKLNIVESIGNMKKEIGTDYLDLVLLHNPAPNYINAWVTLQKNYAELGVRYIGTSNFNSNHLDTIYEKTGINPYLNQIELSLWNQPNSKLIEYHNNSNIIIQAHSIFTNNSKIYNSDYVQYCNENNFNPYELACKYLLEQNIPIIIGTSNISHLKENFNWVKTKNNKSLDFVKLKIFDCKYQKYNKFI